MGYLPTVCSAVQTFQFKNWNYVCLGNYCAVSFQNVWQPQSQPKLAVIGKPTIIWDGTVLQSVTSGSLQMSTLDTNGNNGMVSITRMDVEFCIKWQLFPLWETCVYIGMFAVLPNAPRCLKDKDSTSLWACVYVLQYKCLHLTQCM